MPKFISIRLLVLVVGIVAACAQLPAESRNASPATPDYASWPQDESELKPDAQVRYGVLANGMRYAVMRNTQPEGTISLRLRIASGSLQESGAQRGLAHFMEHMAFNGSKNVPEGEFIKLLQRKGLAFGAHTNAYTSTNETVYTLELPKNDADLVDTGFMLFREIGDRLTLDPKAIDREKGVVLSELRARNTPEYRTFEARWKLWFEGQLQADRMPIGTVETISGANRELLADYYARFYRPERTLLIAVGDFDAAEIEAKIKAKFSDWRAEGGFTPDPDLGSVKERGLVAATRSEPNIPEDATVTWFRNPDNARDTAAERLRGAQRGLALQVVNRRLGRIAREKNAPFVTASVSTSETRYMSRSLNLSVQSRPGEWRTAMQAAEQELRRAAEHGFYQSELDRELKAWRAALEDAVAKAETRRNAEIANDIAGAFESRDVYTHPRDDLAIFESYAAKLTREATLAALRELLESAEGPVVFVSSSTPVDGGERAVAAAYEESAGKTVAAAPEQEAKAFPYASFGAPGSVVEKSDAADLDISMYRFANGVRLNMRPTEFETDTIYVLVRYAGGYLHMPRNRIGLDWALPFAFLEGGLSKLTADELDESLTGRIVSTDFKLDEEAFEFNGRTNRRDLALQLQLMAAYATDPAYRPNGLARLQAAAENYIKQYSSSPGRVLSRETPALLRSGDPRWTFPSLKQMQALTMADVERVVKPVLARAPIEISVVGDVDKEAVIAAVGATFGALPARAAKLDESANARAVRFPANARTLRFTHEGRPDQASAYMAWPAPDFFSNTRRARTIALLREIVKVRMIEEFREAQGATYSPSVVSWHSGALPGFGFIAASAETRPELVAGFYKTLDEIVTELKAGRIDDDVIVRAREPIVKAIETDRRSNGYWLRVTEDVQSEPRALPAIRSQLKEITSITKDELVAAARTYFDPRRQIAIRVLPRAAEVKASPVGRKTRTQPERELAPAE